MDEAEFRRGIRDRLAPAWERLERLYGHTLRRQASLILPAGMDPDNAVGDVWVRALDAARTYDPALSPFPWLARICATTCFNQRRGRFRLYRAFRRIPPPPPRASETAGRAARTALRAALQSLPRRECEVVTLRFLFEVSVAEIAELLGLKPNSVNQTLLRGLAHLRTSEMAPQLQDLMSELERRP